MSGTQQERGQQLGGWSPTATVNDYYERMFNPEAEAFYDHSDFFNFGLWDKGAATPREASERLMQRLLAFVPEKRGQVLDAGCGKGATTRYLLQHYRAEDITGINISERQLERCRQNAPDCQFLYMDATQLEFENASFDLVMHVETAHHFNTRETFLREAFRVLKPGGRIIFSELLMSKIAEERGIQRHAANYLDGPTAYRELLARVGFSAIQVIDVTARSTKPFYLYAVQQLMEKFRQQKIAQGHYANALRVYRASMRATRFYLVGTAQKPIAA